MLKHKADIVCSQQILTDIVEVFPLYSPTKTMNPGQRDYFRGKQPEDEVMNSTESNEDFPKGNAYFDPDIK